MKVDEIIMGGFMKKILITVLIVILILSTVSCAGPMGNRLRVLNKIINSDDVVSTETLEQILEYVENKDSDGLKSMYSQKIVRSREYRSKNRRFYQLY